jgi:putative RecB family exonuclease
VRDSTLPGGAPLQQGPRQPPRPPQTEQLGFEGMPEKLFVCTPSKLAAFDDCPRRYRFSYVDRPAPAKGPAWAHNSLGASVHSALRGWYLLPPAQRTPAALPTLLRATWVSEGYRDEAQERAIFALALQWLRDYLAEADPHDDPVGVERFVAAKTSILALNGRADRIDRRGDELVIVDYKTGRSELSDDDARGSRALALYAYATSRVFRRACYQVELHHLPTGTVSAFRHTDASLARHVTRAEETARDIKAAERSVAEGADPDQAYPTRPGALCGWCDYRRVCPAGAQLPGKEPWAGVLRDAPEAREDPQI